MTRNPIINALAAIAYIAAISSVMFYAPILIKLPAEDTVFMPILFLSLFVFSAASMGYIFLGQPVMLFLEGKKQEAAALFLKTLFAFAACALIFVAIGFYLTSTL